MENEKKEVRVRIAPSPTGDPHVGTAYIALFNIAFAKSHNGKFVLRIEDTDRTRSSTEFEKMILESLKWLNLNWDEGPDVNGPYGPYRQSERKETYKKHASELVEKGEAYYCFCPPERLEKLRKIQLASRQQPKYDGFCKNLSAEEITRNLENAKPHVVRLKVPQDGETEFTDLVRGKISFQNSSIDDQILLKSDGYPTYHLANVVDDHLMKITHVIRAEEWIPSTCKHILLYKAFGWESPQFVHMPLLRNQDRSKISKRKNPTSLKWYQSQGYLPESLINFLALMGFSMPDGSEIFDLNTFINNFSTTRINTSAPVFDLTKLDWLNGVYIRSLKMEELTERIINFGVQIKDREKILKLVLLVQERLKKLSEFNELTDYFYKDFEIKKEMFILKDKTNKDCLDALNEFFALIKESDMQEHKKLEEAMKNIALKNNWRVGDFFMLIRICLTGKKSSLPLIESFSILGKEKILTRIETSLKIFC